VPFGLWPDDTACDLADTSDFGNTSDLANTSDHTLTYPKARWTR
jgi:hypothetical protein